MSFKTFFREWTWKKTVFVAAIGLIAALLLAGFMAPMQQPQPLLEPPTEAPTEQPTFEPTEEPVSTATPFPPFQLPSGGPSVMQPPDSLAEYMAINPEVCGWIYIPGTFVSYPVVRGRDNSYYLSRTWDKKVNSTGAIFMDCRNNTDFTDQNTVIYGHHRRNYEMFNSLDMLLDREYLAQFNKIYITLDDRVIEGEIFAISIVQPECDYRRPSYNTKQEFDDYIQRLMQFDRAKTGVVPQFGSRILVLSTCNYMVWRNGRMAVCAVFRESDFDGPWTQNK